MTDAVAGFHHVTAICSAPQPNLDFHARLLGRRLVKRTVNFDEPTAYHLYYGDRTGSPGTVLTFFAFLDAGPGRCGPGMASALAYAVDEDGLLAMVERLSEHDVAFDGPVGRFGERVLGFADPDRLPVELIERPAMASGDTPGPLAAVTLRLDDPEPTARLLTDVLGLGEAGSERGDDGERWRFALPDGGSVDLLRSDAPTIGRQGAGTIHHVAFRARDGEEQRAWRERLLAAGLDVTEVIDRRYFDAIYAREPGGVLFEIATDPPGFTVDEAADDLGRSLMLPPRHEPERARLERLLPPIEVPR